jgi:predicted nucleic acid-binding protein
VVFAEEDSGVARALWGEAQNAYASQLIYPEARAAVAAASRSGRIGQAALRRATAAIDDLCAELHLIGVDGGLARRAGELAEQHALRGYDAVHLATALSIDDPNLVVATWDRDLAGAALACGCAVAPPVT